MLKTLANQGTPRILTHADKIRGSALAGVTIRRAGRRDNLAYRLIPEGLWLPRRFIQRDSCSGRRRQVSIREVAH